jgi:hypothetical protein
LYYLTLILLGIVPGYTKPDLKRQLRHLLTQLNEEKLGGGSVTTAMLQPTTALATTYQPPVVMPMPLPLVAPGSYTNLDHHPVLDGEGKATLLLGGINYLDRCVSRM